MKRLVLLLFGVVVAAERLAVVFAVGSPVPYHDQWYAEAQGILLPWCRHVLSPGLFFAPNGEHVIVLTRLLSLGLVALEGRWDCITQMVVNCLLSPLCLITLVRWLADHASRRSAPAIVLVIAVLYGSPLFYGNVVWGFQSQILLLIAFSLLHLELFTRGTTSRARWVLGALSGLLAALCFASGYLAAIIAGVVVLGQWRTGAKPRREALASVLACAAIVGLGCLATPAHPALASVRVADVLHTLVHALGWPARFFSYWGVIVWAPFAAVAVVAIRARRLAAGLVFPFAGAAWALAQAVAISVGRSAPAVVLAPRYYDIFAVGVVANLALLLALARSWSINAGATRKLVFVAVAGWCGTVGWNALSFAISHTRGDLPVIANLSRRQVQLLAHYYQQGGGPATLEQVPFPARPLPDALFLARMLDQPEIKALLPWYLTDGRRPKDLLELPWLGERDLRRGWFDASSLVAALSTLTLAGVAAWTWWGPTLRSG